MSAAIPLGNSRYTQTGNATGNASTCTLEIPDTRTLGSPDTPALAMLDSITLEMLHTPTLGMLDPRILGMLHTLQHWECCK